MQVIRFFLTGLLSVIVLFEYVKALPAEPVCSKFDYEMKTLEAMLRIENRAEKMMEEMKAVQNYMTKELDEIKNLKDKVERQLTAMESKITTLKSEVDKVSGKVNSVQDSLTKELGGLKNTTGEVERQLTAMESKITTLRSEVEVKLEPDEVIAFSMRSPTKKAVNGVPTFGTVITNKGNGYDVDTGIFTCPVDGLYMFVVTVASNGQHDVYCYIRHNGTDKVLGRSYIDNSYTTATASVNLLLQKGDFVTLGNCGGLSNLYGGSHTTFSGALLQKTERKN